MRKFAGLFFISVLLALSAAGSAGAQQYNHRITVYAYVPQMRAIYIDKNGNLVKVAGNTASNITPQAFDTSNRLITMTSSYMSQYRAFLAAQSGALGAGRTYVITPNEPRARLDLDPVKAVNRKSHTEQQTDDNYRYIGPKMKMALVY